MKSSLYQSKSLRLFILIGLPLALALIAIAALYSHSTPPCLFYSLTGLYCPGCGSGRCFYALLHGRLYAAFRFQPLLMLALPPLAYYVVKIYLAFLLKKDVLPFPTLRSSAWGYAAIGIILAYWVLRNVPVFPFSLLAPTAV